MVKPVVQPPMLYRVHVCFVVLVKNNNNKLIFFIKGHKIMYVLFTNVQLNG